MAGCDIVNDLVAQGGAAQDECQLIVTLVSEHLAQDDGLGRSYRIYAWKGEIHMRRRRDRCFDLPDMAGSPNWCINLLCLGVCL